MSDPNFPVLLPKMNMQEALACFRPMLDGDMPDRKIKVILSAINRRGNDDMEIAVISRLLKDRMIPIKAPANAMDVCGTGGDGQHTLNVSTAVAIVVAACGVPVAKHGNRAASSKAGAADTLEALGLDLEQASEKAEATLADLGICFLFAQKHHPALARLAPIRKELGHPTIFNVIGPLVNPANVRRQLIGVSNENVLRNFKGIPWEYLEMERVMVVSGGSIFDDSAIDEISISGPTKIASFGLPTWVGDQITPEVAGVGMHPLSALRGGDAVFNAGELHKLLMASADQTVAYRDSVLINSAGALIVAGEASSWNEGVARAAEAIDNGKARSLLDRWIEAVS